MNRLPMVSPRKTVLVCLSVFFLFGFQRAFAENVVFTGDYTTPGIVYSDLLVANGSVNITSPGDLVVHGDLKITSGQLFMGPTAGSLKVYGDLIITNTEPGGDATAIFHNNVEVTGAVILKSESGDAFITTTYGSGSTEFIKAERIITRGYGQAMVYARGELNVVAEIDTKSITDQAFVESLFRTIYAGSIVTNGYSDAYVQSDLGITVNNELITYSEGGDATVQVTAEGDIYAGSLATKSGLAAYIAVAAGKIEVKEALSTTSTLGDAYIKAEGIEGSGTISAGVITTHGYNSSYVEAYESIEVRGDLITRSDDGDAYVWAGKLGFSGYLRATNVVTYAADHAYVKGHDWIEVLRDISTYSAGGQAYVECTGGSLSRHPSATLLGSIYAYRITTNGGDYSYVKTANGAIIVRGPINTRARFVGGGLNPEAYVHAHNGKLRAESIFTHGYENSYIDATTSDSYFDIWVRDIIRTKADNGDAYVQGNYHIRARSIETNAGSGSQQHGHIYSQDGSILVDGDIRTNAPNGDAYVDGRNGDVHARSIKISGNPSSFTNDNYIRAYGSTGRFQLFPKPNDESITIKDSIFYLDTDHTWNTELRIEAESEDGCVLNGNGHRLYFGSNGGIVIEDGATLHLKNIILDNVSGTQIRFEGSGYLYLHNVQIMQGGNTTFNNGTFYIHGDCSIGGPGTVFTTNGECSIHVQADSRLTFGHGIKFQYNGNSVNKVSMESNGGRIHFNGSTFYALQDARFAEGTLAFENAVCFMAATDKTITFRSDLTLDHLLRSEFSMQGNLDFEIVP